MSTVMHVRPAVVPHWLRHATWFVVGAGWAFLVPYLGVSLLGLQHDAYLLAYFTATVALLVVYVWEEAVPVREIVTHAWPWSLGLGIAVGLAEIANILGEKATSRPAGSYFAFELLWRGVSYGAVDALLLSAFPGLVVYGILRGRIGGVRGKLRFTALALPMILAITAAYHLGYPQYREDGVRKPEVGNTVISLPMLATANPIGSLVAHATMHTAAVAHSYETDVYLPPQTSAK